MKYNRKILRELIKKLTESEFYESLDDFRAVREQFTDGQKKYLRDEIVLDYFEKHQEEIDKLLEAIKKRNFQAYTDYEKYFQCQISESVVYNNVESETSAKFLPILPKTLQTWEENRYAFIENLLCILKKQLNNSLFFINSFLLSSKFIEEFVLDEADLKDKLKDLAMKPVSDGICPLIACSEWCRFRFCDRGDRKTFNPTLAQEIENWQNQVIQSRKEVNLNKIKEFVKQSFNKLKDFLKKSDIRLQIEIEPELDRENNTGQFSESLLLNMTLWVRSKDLPLARYAENVRLDLKINKQNSESESESLYTCLQERLPDLIHKARYSLHILVTVVKLEIEFFLPLDYYNTPLEKITFNYNRRFRELGEEYRLFINSFNRYFDEKFWMYSDIYNKKDRLWNSDNNIELGFLEQFKLEDIFYIGTDPSLSDLEIIEEAKAIAVWSRNKEKPLVEGDEGHIKISEWKDWPDKIHNLRKQEKDLEITLFWDDLYPKPSQRCRPLNTNLVE